MYKAYGGKGRHTEILTRKEWKDTEPMVGGENRGPGMRQRELEAHRAHGMMKGGERLQGVPEIEGYGRISYKEPGMNGGMQGVSDVCNELNQQKSQSVQPACLASASSLWLCYTFVC